MPCQPVGRGRDDTLEWTSQKWTEACLSPVPSLICAIRDPAGLTAKVWDHAGIGAWVMIFSTAKCFLVSLLALKYGEKTITRSDWVSLVACLAAIPLWILTGNPLASVLLLFVIETLAFYPTFRKTWHKPFEETLWAYNISSLQFIFGLMALENYTFITMIGGISLIISNTIFVIYTLIRRRIILNAKTN
jgi:hypothetical protein